MASRVFGQDLRAGLELGHYRIIEKIGGGGMGDYCNFHWLESFVFGSGALSAEGKYS